MTTRFLIEKLSVNVKQQCSKQIVLLSAILIYFSTLTACSIHVIDVQQGNAITQETVEKLKIGMDKKQVAQIAGTPLINDPFHYDRWDYIYQFTAGDSDEAQSSAMTLYFVGNKLTRIDIREQPPKEEDIKKPSLRSTF